MKNRQGASLAELMVVITLLLLLFAGIFVVFQASSRGFYHSVLRVGAVGEAIRLHRVIDRDVTLTHFNSVGMSSRQVSGAGALVRRDGVSFAGLSNWSKPTNFEDTGQPRWDRYIVYYATDESRGRLIRLELDPGPPFLVPARFGSLPSVMVNDPSSVPGLVRHTTLLKDVYAFQVDIDGPHRLVRLRARIFRTGGKRMLSEAAVEELQDLDLTGWPANSYPEL